MIDLDSQSSAFVLGMLLMAIIALVLFAKIKHNIRVETHIEAHGGEGGHGGSGGGAGSGSAAINAGAGAVRLAFKLMLVVALLSMVGTFLTAIAGSFSMAANSISTAVNQPVPQVKVEVPQQPAPVIVVTINPPQVQVQPAPVTVVPPSNNQDYTVVYMALPVIVTLSLIALRSIIKATPQPKRPLKNGNIPITDSNSIWGQAVKNKEQSRRS